MSEARSRLAAVTLDAASIERGNPDQEHERAIAIYDLVEDNVFAVPGHDDQGPFTLNIQLFDAKLALNVHGHGGALAVTHILSLSPFRRLLKDYFQICESYYSAVRTATPQQIEALDMGRRAVHNEGAQVLVDRLAGKIDIDFDTARRLFTIITALHWKG